MAIRRYSRTPVIKGGTQYGTTQVSTIIRRAIQTGEIRATVRVLQGAERLDILAGQVYGDSSEWWIIAAASGIGWGLQVPPGTRIVIPDRDQVAELVS